MAIIVPIGLAAAQEGLDFRIESVTLSSGGLAEIRRSVAVDAAAELGFDVPLDQVDDILKSLLVYDPAGGVASMSLDGPSPVEETFRGLPFTPQDMSALPRLLGTLQGIPVRVSSGGRTVEGMVLGVDTEPASDDDATASAPILSVITEEGQVAVLRLRADTQLDILDATMREALRNAALVSGQGRIADRRTITLALEGTGTRDVRLDYVVPAPVWKTAYRLILDADGLARLQAWAVIENATGDDWSDVTVTLSSGAPVTLAQRLYERYWAQRPEIPVFAQTIAPSQPDRFRETAAGRAGVEMEQGVVLDAIRAAPSPLPAPAPQAAPAAVSPSAPAVLAEAAEGETAATYLLPAPVDLAAGQTLSVPFVDADLTAERIALFQPERGEVHPVAALRLENTTGASLPPGIVTVYAPHEEGYAGDAQLSSLPPGDSRIVSFAADRHVEVTVERGAQETVYRASLAEGVLRVSGVTRSETRYVVTGAQDAERTVIIEHPRREGWRFSSDALEGSTPTHHRLRVALEAGGSAEVRAIFERAQADSIALVDADADALLYWSGQIDDPDAADALAELAERRQEIARVQSRVSELAREREAAVAGQARIRENLAAVPDDSTLARRYIAMLEEHEDRIADLEARQQEAEQILAELREAFARSVYEL